MSHARKPSDYVLNKKMPDNPRYKNIKPVVDTGSSLRRYLEAVEEMRRNFKFRKDEMFKRIKLHIFVNLMFEVAKLRLENQTPDNNESVPSLENTTLQTKTDLQTHRGTHRPGTPKSSLMSVISGVGELDVSDEEKETSPRAVDKLGLFIPSMEDPYLLLDVREPDDFARCHILTAENYPPSLLSRTMNFESKSLLLFKNKESKIIVVYDEDETRAPKVATTLVQRGYDNIFMLSGGLRLAVIKFPHGLVTGIPPPSCLPVSGMKTKRSLSSSSLTLPSVKNKDVVLRENFNANDLEILERQLCNFSTSSSSSVCATMSVKTTVPSIVAGSVNSVKTTNPNLTPRVASKQPFSMGKSKPWK